MIIRDIGLLFWATL